MAETAVLPLLAHAHPESIVAYRNGRPVALRKLMSDVADLQARMPPVRHVLNICSDRYLFLVGLIACILGGRTSLLSPSLVPEVVNHLRKFAPDTICFREDGDVELDLPSLQLDWTEGVPTSSLDRIPSIANDQLIAYVFTSGSTGTPVPHRKTWAQLVDSVRIEAARFQLPQGRRHSIVATVPVQHMYGFETSLLMPLQTGHAFASDRPFYPADIANSLARVPAPRVLATTPLHLQALQAAGIDLPAIDLIVCATALLEAGIAHASEARFGARLMEIYGSTETGQIASRRTTSTEEWELWPDVRLEMRDGRTWACGGAFAEPIPLGDVVELTSATTFLLRGRTEDLVNIAGKRSSLAFLSHQLNEIDGVTDGVFYRRDDDEERSTLGTARLGALAVAPGKTVEDLMQQLKRRIDPAFLPRPLRLVDRIPRNTTGKLRLADLDALIAQTAPGMVHADIRIEPDHPAFAGHFPADPIVPGAVLLDEILRAIRASNGLFSDGCTISSAKFKRIVRPGDPLRVGFTLTQPATVRFELRSDDVLVAEGTLRTLSDDLANAH